MRVQSLGQEDLLKEVMATHSGTLAWRIPWTEEPGGLQSMESQRVGHNFTFTFTYPGRALFPNPTLLVTCPQFPG